MSMYTTTIKALKQKMGNSPEMIHFETWAWSWSWCWKALWTRGQDNTKFGLHSEFGRCV